MTNKHANNIILDLDCHGVVYGNKIALQPFHLSVHQGQNIAVIGASGAGKSTILKTIFDHCKTTEKRTALIPQELGLVENLSVFHNVFIGRLDQYSTLSNLINLVSPRFWAKDEVRVILEKLSLEKKLLSACDELSGGQQQRIAIARAIFRQAPILIADEPVANLDKYHAELALQLMIDQHKISIMALHNTDQAIRFFDHIIGITNGTITLDTPTAKLNNQDLDRVYNIN